jgi:hypothetical protein
MLIFVVFARRERAYPVNFIINVIARSRSVGDAAFGGIARSSCANWKTPNVAECMAAFHTKKKVVDAYTEFSRKHPKSYSRERTSTGFVFMKLLVRDSDCFRQLPLRHS